jgi:hypothetical protein
VVDEIKKNAEAYRDAKAQNVDVKPIELKQSLLNYHLSQESYYDYLKPCVSAGSCKWKGQTRLPRAPAVLLVAKREILREGSAAVVEC